ncbi:hypothetical protein AUEXF2481DRAFT_206752 [Aureobasidium subglaciale EXF-2481]|uniref:Uncharacterized protein n=1 Tax=Aureobasidium subglaciale (strain EXF-2481) TaxID=1043005 RepID=A0A074YQC0_AURSE|nr:uncharacterized protein AUEXF2481DRAFT_206752 [Aureobasidium subglaciale EXF-2481]KEQ99973.1 hypothetical protein AUEXF2481DRAFT_206752 [Aureobasidium subglaciale EXF-2481]
MSVSQATILAEIQRLQEELAGIKRSSSSKISLEVTRTLQTPQHIPITTPAAAAAADQCANMPLTNNSRPLSNDRELPHCWNSCCNGRTFSTQSNLVRHQREKRGVGTDLKCSFCGVGFSRSGARKAHEAERRCRNL